MNGRIIFYSLGLVLVGAGFYLWYNNYRNQLEYLSAEDKRMLSNIQFQPQ